MSLLSILHSTNFYFIFYDLILLQNDRGLYNLLTRNASGHSQTMFEAMEAHKGYCWEAEVARAKLVIEKSVQIYNFVTI